MSRAPVSLVVSVRLVGCPVVKRRVGPAPVVEVHPPADSGPGLEAVGELGQVDALVLERSTIFPRCPGARAGFKCSGSAAAPIVADCGTDRSLPVWLSPRTRTVEKDLASQVVVIGAPEAPRSCANTPRSPSSFRRNVLASRRVDRVPRQGRRRCREGATLRLR